MAPMMTALAVLLGILGAGVLPAFPVASALLFVGAYYAGRRITMADVDSFSGVLFVLAAGGFISAFF